MPLLMALGDREKRSSSDGPPPDGPAPATMQFIKRCASVQPPGWVHVLPVMPLSGRLPVPAAGAARLRPERVTRSYGSRSSLDSAVTEGDDGLCRICLILSPGRLGRSWGVRCKRNGIGPHLLSGWRILRKPRRRRKFIWASNLAASAGWPVLGFSCFQPFRRWEPPGWRLRGGWR